MIEMVKADIKEIHETIKTMLSYAMALSESPIPEMYELGQYLADNILTKACLAVAIDKGEEQHTFDIKKSGKRWTHGLPQLYDDHLKNHYPKVPDYDPNIKKFHDDRNVYQHDVDFFDMTMRQPRAKAYVELVEEIMKTVGIIKSGEIIRPSNLSPFGANNLTTPQSKTIEAKYQIKELINVLESYENVKEDVDLEKRTVQELANLFPSLVKANIGFTFPADARLNHIKNINYEIIWRPIEPNPTTKFLIRRMENRVRRMKPEEAYYSQKNVNDNPDLYNETAVRVLEDLIEYIKSKI